MNLDVTYSVWKQVAQNQSWATYHWVDGTNSRRVWTGDRDHTYESFVDADNFSDWDTNFGTGSTEVSKPDDAVALIVGLSGVKPKPLSADGTPVFSKHQITLGRSAFKRIDNGTELMNVDGRASGSSSIIWDGDASAWTASGSGSSTTEAAHAGSYGWDSGTVGANSNTDFNNGSEIDVAGTYDQLSFWIQPKAYPGNAVLQVQWRNGSGTVIGSTLNVENYVTNMDLDAWQKVTIPIADFNLDANVQVFRVTYKVGTQRHWFDEFNIQASGGTGPYEFRVSSPTGYVYHVERVIIVVSASDIGWTSTSFANISGGLENGLLMKYHKIGASPETYWSFNNRNNAEMFGQFKAFNDVNFDDSEQLVAFALHPELSSVILIDDDEVLDLVVRDDLSSLTSLRAFLHYGVEVIG